MRAYWIDEVSHSHMEVIQGFLKKNTLASIMRNLYWLQIPDDLLSDTQRRHRDCRPHVVAVELGVDWIKLELLVRSLKNMHCTCPGYCTPLQRDYVINFANGMLEDLKIRT
jgi:hypothetical protein